MAANDGDTLPRRRRLCKVRNSRHKNVLDDCLHEAVVVPQQLECRGQERYYCCPSRTTKDLAVNRHQV